MKPKIAVVIPTIRPERREWMTNMWSKIWEAHDASVIWVNDGPTPTAEVLVSSWDEIPWGIPIELEELVFNLNDGVRNLGFYWAKRLIDPDIYITLDDDVRPMGNDPIQEHLDILEKRVPTSWFSSTLYPHYMRGFPYGVRKESDVVVSHGVWHGVPDLDAVTQLTQPDIKPEFYRGVVPSGCEFPVCGMNLAWTKAVAKHVYFAPMGPRTPYNRFADIWMGRHLKRKMDELGLAMATGFSRVWHERASDVWKNLAAEAGGLLANESHSPSGEYAEMWERNRNAWYELMK